MHYALIPLVYKSTLQHYKVLLSQYCYYSFFLWLLASVFNSSFCLCITFSLTGLLPCRKNLWLLPEIFLHFLFLLHQVFLLVIIYLFCLNIVLFVYHYPSSSCIFFPFAFFIASSIMSPFRAYFCPSYLYTLLNSSVFSQIFLSAPSSWYPWCYLSQSCPLEISFWGA